MERLSETCRVSYKNKSFEITGASCWLYYRNMNMVTGIIWNSGSSVNIKSFWYEIGESFDN